MNSFIGGWAFVIIGGPILLVLALLFGKWRNRNTPTRNSTTEEGTRRRYDELNAEQRSRED